MNRFTWLERELDKDNLDPALRVKYNAEADAIADQITAVRVKKVNVINKVLEEQELEQQRLDLQDVEESLQDLAVKLAGDSAPQWLEVANRLYSVDGNNRVTSMALGPDHLKYWDCDSVLEAKRKILQLIRYKYRDHFERGHDFFYYPEKESEAS